MSAVKPPDPLVDEQPSTDKEKKALIAIRKLRRRIHELEYRQSEPIAIAGLSCRFPGAADAHAFWRLLDAGVEAVRDVPPERWDVDAYFDPDPDAPGKVYTRRAGYLDDVEGFDAAFFGISPREAEFMDPQQRILLEQAWCALENAGIAPADLQGSRTGVFVGITTCDYGMLIQEAGIELSPYYITGNTLNVSAGRLAYVLRLNGPALAIDTACSSSLVAVHQACASLRRGECDLALVAGVNLLLSPQPTIASCRAHMVSADGRCKTFDAAADGFVRGEGCGVVVLKRLSDAERDRDRIQAVIRASAVNQDGRSGGLTVPNGPAQERLISDAVRAAGLSGADVHYLEAHGTGTSLGDPIEVQAAARALAADRRGEGPLLVGSVKTNIGHLEAAAGIAGLIKVVLALQHHRIPRHLNFAEPSPHIPWDELDVRVVAEAAPWPAGHGRRVAGVSAFGFSGTNAHVIVEEAPELDLEDSGAEPPAERSHRLLALSGHTAGALTELGAAYRAWLEDHDGIPLADVCHTANTGRSHFRHRAALVFASAEQLGGQLAALAGDATAPGLARGESKASGAKPRVAFLFSGQGGQYTGMARELYEQEPVYREHFDRCAAEFARLRPGEPGLLEVVFEEAQRERLKQTGFIQPALYALQVSLAALWRSWGIVPDAVLGHSAGEYAAASVAGVFGVEDGLRLIVERARLMQALPSGGGMLTVTAPVDRVEAAFAGDDAVCVSAYHGLNTVISGPMERLDALMKGFEAQEIACSMLPAANAFHSAFVDPVLDDFEAFARGVRYDAPSRTLVSTLSGTTVDTLGAAYWRDQARQPVRFADALATLFERVGCDAVVEVGPQAELMWLAQMCWRPDHRVLWASSLAKGRNALEQMLNTAGQLYVEGAPVDLAGIEGEARRLRRKVDLPSYPFQRRRYWVEMPQSARMLRGPLKGCLYRTVWERRDATTSGPRAAASWLVLADQQGTGAAVCRELEARGHTCLCLDAQAGEGSPAEALARRVEEALERHPRGFDHVLHLGGADPGGVGTLAELERAQERGVESALRVAQLLVRRESAGRLWLVTRGVQRVLDSDGVEPAHSPIWGLGKAIAMEQPRIWGGLIDLPSDAAGDVAAAALVDACGAGDYEDHVALRGDGRWVARLLPEEPPARASFDVSEDATYLITGGLGGIGLAAAKRLARRGARHLVLTGRGAPSPVARRALEEIRGLGCEAQVLRADVAREDDLVRLFDEIERGDLPPVKGLIHAAGVESIVALEDATREELYATMGAKVFGAWLLDRLTTERGMELSFFVCVSSITAVWGSAMQASYAAGNQFLNALCEARELRGQAATAVCYGPWRQEGIGMSQGEVLEWLKSRGVFALNPDSALDGMEMALAGSTGTVVANVNWSVLRELTELQRPRPLLEYLGAAKPQGEETERVEGSRAMLGELRAMTEAERTARLLEVVRGEVGQVLGIAPEELDGDTSFVALGMDSLMAVKASNSLRDRIGSAAVSVQLLFEQPTIRKLAETLSERLDLDAPSVAAGAHASDDAAPSPHEDRTEWPASLGQQWVWVLQQADPTSPQCNLPVAVRFKGGVALEHLERALDELMHRHDALRTTLESRDGDLVQVVHGRRVPVLRVIDLGDGPDPEAALEKVKIREARRLFDMVRGPLVRFALADLGSGEQVLLITVHHAIADGVSLRVLLAEFLTLLESYAAGATPVLDPPSARFGAYAEYERERVTSRLVQEEVAYWREQLHDIPPLELPASWVRPAVLTHNGDSIPVVLPPGLYERVREFSSSVGVTPFATLLAAWSLLLSRYSGQHDFGVGTAVAGRSGPRWDSVIGIFVNMVTMRMRIDPDWRSREFLSHAESVVKGALAHQTVPFDWLVKQINPLRDPSRTPLYQAALILLPPNREFEARARDAGIVVEDLQPVRGTAPVDVALTLAETTDGYQGYLEYNTDLFERWRIEQMAGHFEHLLLSLTSASDEPVSRLPLLPAAEREHLLTAWNRTARSYPTDTCLHERVAEHARARPKAVAVVCRGARLTYRELNRRANRLAHHLRRCGVGPDVLVGVCLERSLEMMVGVLGVMKAGGAYVPLDPEFPQQRLRLMLDDAGLATIVTSTALLDRLPEHDAAVVCVDRDSARIAKESARDPKRVATSADPVYVVYTSGSTGKPKGVVITHRNLMNLLCSMAEEIGFTSREVMVALATLSFDMCKPELYLPLLQGACTVVATPEEARDAELLKRLIEDNRATIMQASPATWSMLLTAGWSNAERMRALCGSEALHPEIARRLLGVTDSLWNLYGPTETTVWSTLYRVREVDRPSVPLGYPLANTELHVLDEHLQLVPLGVAGELFIGGDGVARGYLNQPELTAERFIRNPFGEDADARLYRTGDLCQRLADGRIEFLGRRDHQVKVRGFRIELGDIEVALAACPGIRDAAVRAWTGADGFNFIVGYVVADPDQRPEPSGIRASLRERLPSYMIPGMFMFLDSLPLTPNRKVDRRSLPPPEQARDQAAAEFVAPRTRTEADLAALWKQILGVERVGIHDNFFDLGGHSLLMVRLMAELRERYDARFAVGDLYQYATVEGLAEYLERLASRGGDAAGAAAGGTREPVGDRSLRESAITIEAPTEPDGAADEWVANGHRYTYRMYRDGDKSAAIASFAEAFGHEAARAAADTFDWKYLENPFVPDDKAAVQILESDGEVVGMQGGMFARFRLGADTVPGAWGCDAHVAPSHRAASAWFFRHVEDNIPTVALSVPNDTSYPILVALDAVVDIGRISEFKACLDMGPLLRTRGFGPLLSSIGGAVFFPIAKAFELLPGIRAGDGLSVRELAAFDGRFDRFWQSACTDYPGIMVRDSQFLSWRFDRCPNRRYLRYCAERDGEVVGYLVARDRQLNGAGRGRIVDFLVRRGDGAALSALLRKAMRDFRSRGIVSVVCPVITPDRAQLRALRMHGFLYRKPGPHVVASRDASRASLAGVDDWFITYADGDNDYCEFEDASA